MKKTVKKALAIAFALIMVFGLIPLAPVVKAASPPVNFVMNYEIDGDYVDVTLTFKDCAGLYALDMQAIYDESELICDSVTPSYDFSYSYLWRNYANFAFNTSYAGQILMGIAFLDELKETELEFCTIRFQIIGDFTETVIRLEQRDNLPTLLNSLVITKPSESTVCKHEDLNKDYLCDNCSEIVLGDDTDIVLENSVIFSKDKKTLVAYLGKDTEYTVPSTVEKIADSAFYGAASLEKISADSVKEIGEKAFENCSSLQNFSIPSTVTSVAYATFAGCTSLNSIAIPSSVTSIDSFAFGDCTSLGNVTIPDSVTKIGAYAFSGCKTLATATLSKSLTEIAFGLFYNCSELETITIPEKVSLIDTSAFRRCTGLTHVVLNKNLERIADYAFEACSGLLSVNIPSSVKIIALCAFSDCSALEEVIFNEGLQYLSVAAFENCTSLKAVSIPTTVEYIAHYVFDNCSSLEEINLPDSLMDMETDSFIGTAHYNDKANWVNGEYYICNHLVKLSEDKKINGAYEVREGTKLILDDVYSGQENMTAVTLPEGTTKLGMYSFYNTGISEITIPSSVTKLEYKAFADCSSLTEIELPDSVVRLAYCTFYNTPFYKDAANWENGVLYIGNSLVDAVKPYPASRGEYYKDAQPVSGVYEIKDGTKYVATSAFSDTLVTEISVPRSVELVDVNAFYSDSLEKIIFYNPETVIMQNNEYDRDLMAMDPYSKSIDIKTVIYGYKNSTAEKYAKEYGNPFVDMGTAPSDHITEHDYSSSIVSPTCSEKGYTIYFCTCGDYYKSDYTEIIPHEDIDGDGTCDMCLNDMSSESTTNSCSHMCHKSGFMGFVWKLLNFFSKLFRVNPVCECGMAHY